ncbi:DUF2771 domain-containing protein [Streptomyces diastatochromogenes]|uniref:DUF2771 domain-containing protein n=1 Tax=Streptomyces diastatochromogenes TaxID=42236 RepID=A0A233SIV5_STRDA|nr:DUF2771 domain-containing protein [Streptomyces diastatochromogenes]MCZ0988573.1 DUF2771 domain-containing protein [Streptomyces diastatochromogenes]OXY95565.1 DUF2771 domain-containing protein [Streptomyces diastatochromogenes]
MTTLQSALRRRRAVAAAGAVSAGLLVLSACEKPSPVATITVGRNSVNSEALCYNDGKALDAASLAKCAKKAEDIESIKVDPDETVRFGVDPKIADAGWILLVNGRQFTDVSKKTYTTIPGSAFFNAQYGTQGNSNTVSIQMGQQPAKGLWSFKLKKA